MGAARQLSAGVVLAGAATAALDVRSVATSASGANALLIAADITSTPTYYCIAIMRLFV